MDIDAILNNDGYHAPNPAYKKGNGQPKYIITDDPQYAPRTSAGMFMEAAQQGDLNRIGDAETYRKYIDYGITPREGDSLDDYQRNLAERQGFLEKAAHSLVQTISEATLGTGKAFADLFDLVTLAQMRKDSDYQNPISTQLEEWQKQIREATPIWQNPDVNILNGGLFDSSFIFNGLPSVVSSLTLLVPSKAVTFGLTKGASWVTRNGLKFARNMERAHKAAQLGDTAEGVSTIAKINAYINGPASQTAKNIIDYGIGGLTSRLLENYQEGRQTYDEAKPVYTEVLKGMSPQEREKTINSLREEYGDDAADWSSNDSVASLVARKAADQTFKLDMVNVFSDMYQMYAIGKVGRALNGPSRSALNRLNKFNIKTAGMSKEAVDKLIASRTGWKKAKDWMSDAFYGGKSAVISELSEGIEEAVNYIAQEEGFHYGKVLLNQEADSNFWSDRLIDYAKNPQLWDSAFWGVAGGVIFNKTGEYANRFTQAIDKINAAKKQQAETVDEKEKKSVHIPTFREAFKDTELMVRKANLESNAEQYRDTQDKLNRIQNGEDLYHITKAGKLETQEEKDAAKEMVIREFRDKVILDAMDSGNYDLAKEYLSSDELKQAFVDGGHLTKEQADQIQTETLSRGDELLQMYNKNLRRLYNAVADWGENNDADLTEMPAEIFNIIVRENINHELSAQYHAGRIARLERANQILEDDSREELEKAAKENGISDFKSIIEQVYKAQQLGIINAEIADLKAKKQHTTASGQAILRTLEANRKLIQEELEEASGINIENGNDVQTAVNLLLTQQAAASVELMPFNAGEKHTYQVNEGNANFLALADAVQRRDRKILSELSPAMATILARNPAASDTAQETDDAFLRDVINMATTRNDIIKHLYYDKEKKKMTDSIKVLQNINAQLESNYKEIVDLKLNQAFEESRINTTKDKIKARAHDILNSLKDAKGFTIGTRAQSLDTASHLYQQLAKKYGKEEIKRELDSYIRTGKHTPIFDNFTSDEQSTYESITAIVKLNRPENDIALGDIYKALNYNDIYEYSKETDVVELIKESRRKRQEEAAQKSSASQNPNSAAQSGQPINQSGKTDTQANGAVNGKNDGLSPADVPLESGEVGEGRVDIDNGNRGLSADIVSSLSDDEIAQSIATIEQYNQDPTLTQEQRDKAAADLQALMAEQAKRTAASSSTGEQDETPTLDKSYVVSVTKAAVNQLSESNPENINVDELREQIKTTLAQKFTDVEDEVIEDLVDSSIAIVDRKLKRNGESIESALAKNVIKLSRVAINNRSEAAVREAQSILNQTFDDLLDNFNRHLSKGKIDGKYVIPLEALVRYARNITSNEYEAQEMYDAFTKLIAEHPDKYTTIQGRPIVQSKVIENITTSVSDRRAKLDSNFGGRTFNILGLLNNLSDEDKKKVKEVVKSLRPGDKIYVEANYENEKLMDKKDGMFIGGIDFIVVDSQGNKTKIASAPTPMYTNNGGFGEMQDGWYYQFPFGEEQGKKEYPIQTFFKSLFISNSEKAKKFRDLLRQYEALNAKEAYNDEIGGKVLENAYVALEEFAKEIGVNINELIQNKKRVIDDTHFELIPINTKEARADRIRHLAKLDVYTQDRWSLDVEDLNYETDENDVDLMNESFKNSIDNWFNKMVESSEARDYITKRLDNLGDGIYDVGVEVESVGKPVLIVTREEKALPATEAIADQHKDNIHLAAGNLSNTSQVVVSNGQPMSLGGSNTTGRSVVVIDTPDGSKTYINAYPIQASSAVFRNNVKLAAFKEALETRLDELMDEWYRTRNSENLEAFLDMLGHKTKDTRKIGGSLFAGFTRSTLPNGNGFSISYKRVNGKIVPPGSREDGETHYLTFYDTVPTKRGNKARAAVQDFVRTRANNPTIVWNSTPNDTSTLADFKAMKAIVREVIIDSLKVRVDPLNINADNDSNMSYGSFMTRDKDGNFALRVSGVVNPSNNLKQYVQSNGDIVITGLGRDGANGNFSDFVLFNDLVNLTTRPIDGSNFSIFDQADGDFGITYTVKNKSTSSPVEKIEITPPRVALSKVVNDILNAKNKSKQNDSKAIIKAILDRIADSNSSLYNLTKNSKIVNQLLHKNVIFVENFNGATYVMPDGSTQVIPDDAYAAYIPDNAELKVGDKTIKLEQGQIVIGDRFMKLLDGNTGDIIDALHHILHENVHGFIADNDSANPEKNARYIKELNELWDEYTKKRPNSPHAKTAEYNDLEEFLVESLTNIDLIKDLNSITADEPLNNPKKPKSLLGKLFDKLIEWLSDILGNNFTVNKDSLFAKEYAIFEETISNQTGSVKEGKKEVKREPKAKKQKPANTPVEGTLDFKEDEPGEETESNPELENFKLTGPANRTQSQTSNLTINQDDRTKAPKRGRGPKASTIASNVPTLRGALDNLDGDTYFDVREKINNGVISIKCS